MSSESVVVVWIYGQSAILKWDFDFCLLFSVATPAVESGAEESASEIQAPAEAVREEEEEVEEERAEPRDGGEGEWQQISVPVLPPGVLEVGALCDEWGAGKGGGGVGGLALSKLRLCYTLCLLGSSGANIDWNILFFGRCLVGCYPQLYGITQSRNILHSY